MARSREGETKRGTSHAAYAQTFLSFVLSSTPRRPPLANFRITPPPSRGPYAVDVWPEATARPERRSRFYPRRGLTFLDPPPPCQWGCFPLCGFRLDRQFYATDSSLAPLPFTLSVVEVDRRVSGVYGVCMAFHGNGLDRLDRSMRRRRREVSWTGYSRVKESENEILRE